MVSCLSLRTDFLLLLFLPLFGVDSSSESDDDRDDNEESTSLSPSLSLEDVDGLRFPDFPLFPSFLSAPSRECQPRKSCFCLLLKI